MTASKSFSEAVKKARTPVKKPTFPPVQPQDMGHMLAIWSDQAIETEAKRRGMVCYVPHDNSPDSMLRELVELLTAELRELRKPKKRPQ